LFTFSENSSVISQNRPSYYNLQPAVVTAGLKLLANAYACYNIYFEIYSNQIKSNQKQIYIAPYVASESEAHGGDD